MYPKALCAHALYRNAPCAHAPYPNVLCAYPLYADALCAHALCTVAPYPNALCAHVLYVSVVVTLTRSLVLSYRQAAAGSPARDEENRMSASPVDAFPEVCRPCIALHFAHTKYDEYSYTVDYGCIRLRLHLLFHCNVEPGCGEGREHAVEKLQLRTALPWQK